MKKLTEKIYINKIFEILLISMLSASLCACSIGASESTVQSDSETVVDEASNEADETETQEEFPENDTEGNDASEENEPEVIQEEEPITVSILGTEYDLNTEMLDLSGMTSADVAAVAEAIKELPELKTVNLIPINNNEFDEAEEVTEEMTNEATETEAEPEPIEEDSSLLLSDVFILKEAAPGVHFIYEFDMFGTCISTSDTEVKYINTQIGNEGEESIRQALTILDECEYFLLDDCGIDDEIMAGIRDDFPDTKVVWRVHVGWKTALTDDPIIRMTHGINDTMTEPLKYCNEVVYMDLGHDTDITDISFIANMPLLECLILSDAQFKDLSPVTYCPNLTWLELIYCCSIEDISVISDMESIKYLNISNTNIRDISGIMNMNLDRFCCIGNNVNKEDFEAYKELHPDCMSVSSGNPYGYAWRYDDYGYHYFSYYARMREVFRYDQGSPGGFRWPEDELSEEGSSEDESSVNKNSTEDSSVDANSEIEISENENSTEDSSVDAIPEDEHVEAEDSE